MNLSSSLEDYLEAIYELKIKEKVVRVTDISLMLNVEKPSVNSAVKKLKNLKLVIHEKYENVELTEKGEILAKQIVKKHNVIFKFLNEFLGVPSGDAQKDACLIEHVISNSTFMRMCEFMEFFNSDSIVKSRDFSEMFCKSKSLK